VRGRRQRQARDAHHILTERERRRKNESTALFLSLSLLLTDYPNAELTCLLAEEQKKKC